MKNTFSDYQPFWKSGFWEGRTRRFALVEPQVEPGAIHIQPLRGCQITFFLFCSTLLLTPVCADELFDEPIQNQSEDKSFVYESGERLLYHKCLANFNRGKKCHALLDKLCQRIQNQNTECRLLRVEHCHQKNRKHQTTAEKTCEHGAHTGPCYGIHKTCAFQEALACQQTHYQLAYCPYYKWQFCRKKVGLEKGQFKSKDCRIFHNQEMIRFYERKIRQALRWEARGENQIAQSLVMMNTQRRQMYKQLAEIQKAKQDSLALLILENFVPRLKKQQEALKAQERALLKKIREITRKIEDYSYMGGLCQALGP
jgi:hypothetical protein